MKNEYITTPEEIAKYIRVFQKKRYNKEYLSPVKIHKILYFCYAYWGGLCLHERKVGEKNDIYKKDLFADRFTAGAYGPYIKGFQDEPISFEKQIVFSDEIKEIEGFLDNILEMIGKASVQALMEVSQKDKVYQMYQGKIMPKMEIYKEYEKEVL